LNDLTFKIPFKTSAWYNYEQHIIWSLRGTCFIKKKTIYMHFFN